MIETKFKQTEVGMIPEDWSIFSVGTDCSVKARIGWQGLKTTEYLSHGKYGLITSTDLVEKRINWKTCYFVSKERYEQDPNIIIKDGDILVSKDGTIGKIGIVKSAPFPATLNSGIFVIRSKNKELSQEGLALAFLSDYFNQFIKKLTAGSTIVHLYQKDIINYYFPLPTSYIEQNNISSVLGDIDSLLLSLDKLIAKKMAIKKGAMQQLLTGKKRLKGFEEPWVEKKIGKCASIHARIGWQGLTTNEYLSHGDYYLVGGTDFCNGEVLWNHCFFVDKKRFEQDKKIQLKEKDVLITKDGTIGKVAYIHKFNSKATLNSGVFVLRSNSDSLLQEYLAWVFLSPVFDEFMKKLVAGSTIQHLYQKDIVNFCFLVPCDTKEQQAIALLLSDMDSEITALEAKRKKYETIKQGMMQQLLTGKIRLTNTQTEKAYCLCEPSNNYWTAAEP